MKAVKFDEVNVNIAEKQDQYNTLPAFYNHEQGSVTYCMELSEDEVISIVKNKKVWLTQLTGGRAMQPIMVMASKPVLTIEVPEYDGPEDGHNDYKEPKKYAK